MDRQPKRVVVTENKRSFSVLTFLHDSDVVHVDAPEFARLQNRCDYAIRVSPSDSKHFFFVELKGNDVVKAAKQLICSIENLTPLYRDYGKREAWVISGGWRPAVSTSFQVQSAKARKHGFMMKHRTHTMEIDLTK